MKKRTSEETSLCEIERSLMKKEKKDVKKIIKNILWVILGSSMYGVAYNMFLEPSGIILGGMTGVGMIIHHFIPVLPVGASVFLLNVPLILICIKVFGISFLFKTAVGTFCSSMAIDLFFFLPSLTDELILNAILGAMTAGVGLAIVYGHGYNTGGVDMIVWLMKRVFKKMSAGSLVRVADTAVVLSSAIVFRDFGKIIYSAIVIFTETHTMDSVLAGFEKGEMAFIFSKESDKIAGAISDKLERGVTLLDATGWYSKEKGQVLLCAVRPRETYILKEIVHSCDEKAFIVFTSAVGITGEGFEKVGI